MACMVLSVHVPPIGIKASIKIDRLWEWKRNVILAKMGGLENVLPYIRLI